jgi:hypothetical protein
MTREMSLLQFFGMDCWIGVKYCHYNSINYCHLINISLLTKSSIASTGALDAWYAQNVPGDIDSIQAAKAPE